MQKARRATPGWVLACALASGTATCTLDRDGAFDGSQFPSSGAPGDASADVAVGGIGGTGPGGAGGRPGGTGGDGAAGGAGGAGAGAGTGGVGATGGAAGESGTAGVGDAGADAPPVRPLSVLDARLSYGLAGAQRVRLQTWDDSAGSWFVEPAEPDPGAAVTWVRHLIAPRPADLELIALASGSGTGSALTVLRREGNSGTLDLTIPGVLDGATAARGFDLELEATSGDALLVYSDGGPAPLFRTRSAGAWSAPEPLPLNDGPSGPHQDLSSGPVHWVELEPRLGGDVIGLAYLDANAILVSIAWDGGAWVPSTAKRLSSQVRKNPITGLVSNRAFDLAYEASGTLMVAWADAVSDGLYYETRAPGQFWSGTYVRASGLATAYFDFVDLASEPSSDRIAAALVGLGSPVESAAAATWTGSAWTDDRVFDVQARNVDSSAVGDLPAAVAWAGTTGTAVIVYADDAAGTLDWAKWTSASGWSRQPSVPVTGKATTESIVLRPWPMGGDVLAVLSDSAAAAWALSFDGLVWTPMPGGTPLDVGLASIATAPFDVAFQR